MHATPASLLFLACVSGARAQRYEDRGRISFEVLRSHEEIRPCGDLCGYRSYGRPRDGIYRVEMRLYSEFHRGRVVRTWVERSDIFVDCYDAPPSALLTYARRKRPSRASRMRGAAAHVGTSVRPPNCARVPRSYKSWF